MKLVEDVKRGAEELFKLPMEEKKKLWQKPGDMEGFGGTLASKEGSSDWVHVFYILTLPTHLRNQHLFPNIPLPFRFFLFFLIILYHYFKMFLSLTIILYYLRVQTIINSCDNYI